MSVNIEADSWSKSRELTVDFSAAVRHLSHSFFPRLRKIIEGDIEDGKSWISGRTVVKSYLLDMTVLIMQQLWLPV